MLLQAEVEDMIWEVDEDCDGLVNWPEFQAMWQRCQDDKSGERRWPATSARTSAPRGPWRIPAHSSTGALGGHAR